MNKYEKILNFKTSYDDLIGKTIREILCDLLQKVLIEGECFNGKRPFGNSDWNIIFHEAVQSEFPEIIDYDKDDETYFVMNDYKYQEILKQLCRTLINDNEKVYIPELINNVIIKEPSYSLIMRGKLKEAAEQDMQEMEDLREKYKRYLEE